MILLLRQKNRPDGSDIAELLCPFDKQSQQSFYKNQTAKNNQNNTAAVVESGNEEQATDMSDIEQETDEDYVKVLLFNLNWFHNIIEVFYVWFMSFQQGVKWRF